MMKKLIIAVILIGGVAYASGVSTVNAAGCVNLGLNMRYGSRGTADVVDLQQFLFDSKYLTDTPSGFFGKLTQAAVKKFQSDNGLPSTGIVASMTRAKIYSVSCSAITVKPTNTNNTASAIIAVMPSSTVTPTPTPTPTSVFSLPYSTKSFSDWKTEEGQANPVSDGLQLNSLGNFTTSLSRLTKGLELTNYKLSVSAFVRRGTFILISRFKDDDNYLACNFNGKNIDLVQMLNGKQTTLASAYLDDSTYNNFFFNDVNVSMTVDGRNVGCTQFGNQSNVSTNRIDDYLMSGTVGVKVWYAAPGSADVLVRSVGVETI